jgi:tight adherence protein C
VMGAIPVSLEAAVAAVGGAILLVSLLIVAAFDPARRVARRNLATASRLTSDAMLLQPAAVGGRAAHVSRLEAAIVRRVPRPLIVATEQRLDAAGLAGSLGPERVTVARLLLALLPLLLSLPRVLAGGGAGALVVLLVGPPIGFLLPALLLRMRATARREQVLAALPDTLDLMTITVEAGLALEAAMVRAGRGGKGPLAEELTRTMQEMQAGVARVQALHNLAARCDVADLTAFSSAVAQAERFGVPIARVLRVQSGELREKRRQRAEEAAMKLPTKVILPLALCILPAMMILVVGPSIVQIVRAFAQF